MRHRPHLVQNISDKNFQRARLTATAVVVLFSLSAVELWHRGLGWHDQQRFYQLILLLAATLFTPAFPQTQIPIRAISLIVAILTLGTISSITAEYPQWAIKEVSRYAGLVILALLTANFAKRAKATQHFLLMCILAVSGIHAFIFLTRYAVAFFTGIRELDADLLFSGFANPRFFGQFQALSIPIVGALAMEYRSKSRHLLLLLAAILSTQWCIAITLGGRGLWLSLAGCYIALILINLKYWRTLAIQLCGIVIGSLQFLLMFELIPWLLDLEPNARSALRAGLSARDALWLSSWDMAIASPWLGVGPMHFSAHFNPIAAHPHQVVLQWLAEWGLPATTLAVALAGWGVAHSASQLHKVPTEPRIQGIWLSIIAALILAQVDGVFVMPYTETWLALLIGLAVAHWGKPTQAGVAQRIAVTLGCIPVAGLIGFILVNEVPELQAAHDQFKKAHPVNDMPRFWQQGWIAPKPNQLAE